MLKSQLVSKTAWGYRPIVQDRLLQFPPGFLWGASTSAFQVEGHPQEASLRCSDWASWTVANGNISDGSTADQACQFYQRYMQDIALSKELNLGAFRIGLNWPILRPSAGSFSLDASALSYYRHLLEALKEQGFKTFVTLFHFCLPSWLADKGGWNNPQTIEEFEKFADQVSAELGDLVDFWLTINEPLVYVYQGYVNGVWPPGHKSNYLRAFQAVRHLLEGHARAYAAIKKHHPAAPVSYTMHWRPFVAKHPLNPLDHMVRHYRDQVFNHLFPQAIDKGELHFPFPISQELAIKDISGPIAGLKGTQDFLAINYFTREICEFKYGFPVDIFGVQSAIRRLPTTGLGWEIYPEGLYHLLSQSLAPYKFDAQGKARDIYITENGMATSFEAELADGDWSLDDEQRARYLSTHLTAMHQAIQEGVNVKGYLHWSLIDNFEWADGLQARFGLIRVAYPTQARTLRKSAKIYAAVAAQNALNTHWQTTIE